MEKKSQKNPQKSKNDSKSAHNIGPIQVKEEESLLDRIKPTYNFASFDIECKICNIFCTGPKVYKQHCASKSHMKKLDAQDISSELAPFPGASKNGDSDFHCDVCDKEISGVLQYKQHMEGKVHKKQLKSMKDLEKFKDLVILSEEKSEIQCRECGKMFTGTVPFKEHLNSSGHIKLKKKKKIENFVRQYQADMATLASLICSSDEDDSDGCQEASDVYRCKLCHVSFTGPEAARDHFAGEKHQKVEKKAIESLERRNN